MSQYLNDGLGKMGVEGMEIRSAISTGIRDEQTYNIDHLFKNKRNLIPLTLTVIGTGLLLAAVVSQIWRA
jgi:hypothetical protein